MNPRVLWFNFIVRLRKLYRTKTGRWRKDQWEHLPLGLPTRKAREYRFVTATITRFALRFMWRFGIEGNRIRKVLDDGLNGTIQTNADLQLFEDLMDSYHPTHVLSVLLYLGEITEAQLREAFPDAVDLKTWLDTQGSF